jgi:DNA-binding CsgD family transcriptional regulator
MILDSNYSFEKHHKDVNRRIRATIGKGVSPSDRELSEWWKGKVKFLDDRTFAYIYDLKQDYTFRSTGFSLLGLNDNWSFSPVEFKALFHENQQRLIPYKSLKLFEILLDYPYLFHDADMTYTSNRGIKDVNDNYYLASQAVSLIQFDNNGYATKYYSSYRLVGPYNGEPLTTQVFASPKYPEKQKKMREILSQMKGNMLNLFDFSEAEQHIINCIAFTNLKTSKEIATYLNKSVRTITNQRTKINQKAKAAFPLNNFQSTIDVVNYLQEQLIIEKKKD